MDVSKSKEIVRGFLKDYSSLLVPTVVGLVAGLLFVPTQLMSNKLKERIEDESVSQGSTLRSLSREPVAGEQWKVEQSYQQAHGADANEIALLAEQGTQRQLLSYSIFPEPKDNSTQIFKDFGERFCRAVEELIARVNARDCPTEPELERSLQRASKKRGRGRGVRRLLRSVDATIIDDLCRAKAESASVYANPADLSGYEFWKEYKYADDSTSWDEAKEQCWYSQSAYWIIEDVIDTIAACNSGSHSVLTSPVKRLLGVSFSETGTGSAPRYASGARKKTAQDRPGYLLSFEDGLAIPCTGRISNKDIDVVHFDVSVVVSTQALLPFMQELCSAKQHGFAGWDGSGESTQTFKHNQITILEYAVASVDREDGDHELYRYGEGAVVKLDLICEYIFDRKGYDEIKPKYVKDSVEESRNELEAQKTRRRGRRGTRRTGSTTLRGRDKAKMRESLWE
jgi:hypothetical protein